MKSNIFSLIIILSGSISTLAQTGTVNLNFNPQDYGYSIGDGVTNTTNGQNVQDAIIQPDGKTIIAGDILSFDTTEINGIARINTDGSLDHSFSGGNGATQIYCLALQPDGRILVGGAFFFFNSIPHRGLVRLHPNGAIDTSFFVNLGANGYVNQIEYLPNGQLMVAGQFSAFNNWNTIGVARLNNDGTVDTSFSANLDTGNPVRDVEVLANGQLLIGGLFTLVDGVSRNRIARLNTDGTLDPTFDPGTGANSEVSDILIQPDGRILIAGKFNLVAGASRGRIARLLQDGTLDPSFNTPGLGATHSLYTASILTMELLASGNILAGGDFSHYGGAFSGGIVKLNPNGTRFTGFNVGYGIVYPKVRALTELGNGDLVVAGDIGAYNEHRRSGIIRLHDNGLMDESFNHGRGANYNVFDAYLQPDGMILLGGQFSLYNGTRAKWLTRIHQDGSVDQNFQGGAVLDNSGMLATVLGIELDQQGGIYVIGNFLKVGGVNRKYFARLNPNGTYDPTFSVGTNSRITDVKVQPDQRVLVTGEFTSYGGQSGRGIVRTLATGQKDTSFFVGSGIIGDPQRLILAANGDVYVAGFLTSYNGIPCGPDLMRLKSNGELDTTFIPLFNSTVNGVKNGLVQADGKVVIIGGFTSYGNNATVNRIARLNPDGTLDSTFQSGNGFDNLALSIEQLANGQFLVAGYFDEYDNRPNCGVVLLNNDGSQDTTFSTYAGHDGFVNKALVIDPTTFFACGSFTRISNVGRNRLAMFGNGISLNNEIAVPNTLDEATQLFPNPSNGHLTIKHGTGFNLIRILDVKGCILKEFYVMEGHTNSNIAFTDFEAGVYLVQLLGKEKSIVERVLFE